MERKDLSEFDEAQKDNSCYIDFLKLYYRDFREIGSIVPDSRVCVDALLRFVPFNSAKLILEYGAGSGTVTREMIRRKRQETTLICFERNNYFYNSLVRTVSGQNVFFVCGDVFNSVRNLSAAFGISHESVDCIVSTLPCSFLNVEELLLRAVLPVIKKDGFFIQYVHVLSFLKGFRLNPFLKKYFSQISSHLVLLNMPPAIVYACQKLTT